MEIFKKEFLKLPEIPGVYTFWKRSSTSGTDVPIYIGKSINLKSRLNSYLDLHLGVKTQKMVSEADRVTYIEVTSDLESLLLEADLVHKFKPKYNILLKDDKHALYIVITKEEFPRVLTSRKFGDFGPFPNTNNVKTILRLIRKIFPFSDHKIGKKPCLYSHLGLCSPCPNTGLDKNIYLKNIRNIKLVLSRKFNIVRKNLEKEMKNFSILQNYEEAKIVREKIKLLDYITQEKISTEKFLQNPNLVEDRRSEELEGLKSLFTTYNLHFTSLHRIECFDVAHLSGVNATASMVVAINGEAAHSEYKHFKIKQKNGQNDYDSMREIARRRLNNLESWGKPNLIIVDGGLGQVKIFNDVFEKFKISVVGIAKHPDRLIFQDGKKIRLQGPTLQLVARIRDEAHRFARRLHHKLLSKTLLT
ncbi:MAG: Excinuclease ABC subunit C [uncultured bacterium]|nr:MAG: Excinuclease ABC subunit C [uncultured bacterium]